MVCSRKGGATLTYLNKNNLYEFQLINGLKISLQIQENPYGIPLNNLFALATRKNPKRSFLFVSKLLGKHIPVDPSIYRLAGQALGLRMLEQLYSQKNEEGIVAITKLLSGEPAGSQVAKERYTALSLPEPMTFIGFAETATALGHGMFDSFIGDRCFIHTTREQIPELTDKITFSEEHSHASRHYIYIRNENLFNHDRTVLLVDDELTTGKTSLNIIDALQKKYPRKKYVIATILDWRSEENHRAFREKAEELGVSIEVVSLLKGEYELSGISREIIDKSIGQQDIGEIPTNAPTIQYYRLDETFNQTLNYISANEGRGINKSPYLEETGRFGIQDLEGNQLHEKLRTIGESLKKTRQGKRTLCLGTGEFMYIPMVISAWMGEGIKFHSTTRSPIYPFNQQDYGIRNAYEFHSPEDPTVKNYLYNIPRGAYDEIYLFLERQGNPDHLASILNILSRLNIPYLNVVSCTGENEVPDLGSYSKDDVVFLLKDIGDLIKERDTDFRERAIQSGTHYSEMLPVEYVPSREYVDLFHQSLEDSAEKLAVATGVVAEKILNNKGKDIVLVSLARAGTPIGILIKRYIQLQRQLKLPHYSVSIIREKGLDVNAIKHILKYHPGKALQFIDGWTGKGVISRVLTKSCHQLYEQLGIAIEPDLAVLADPGYCTTVFGSREDFLIPSACLNATVSGLVSRTVHRTDLIGETDFHGAKYYRELAEEDLSNLFIDRVSSYFPLVKEAVANQLQEEEGLVQPATWEGLKDIERIQEVFQIEDINLIKPGIGETTRVLLRRVPWKILVKNPDHENLKHIMVLAREKQVPVMIYTDMAYECCGLIKPLGGED